MDADRHSAFIMVESIVTWAREYKVDGFRFDLMGHHSKANMLNVRRALDSLTFRRDGVDGRRIYVYGEGWNFGEVANNARFVQASQLNMAGTGIGTFSDRLRDAVRGGGPFDEDPRIQGFASGLFTDPNDAAVNGTPEQQRARLLLHHDQIKVGLTGNLRDYRFVDRTGQTVTGAQVDYNGQPAGYAAEPDETITYVDAHDNETLFDVLQYKLPRARTMADRVRMNTVALSTVALAQSPAFWHAGTDLLRSKSLDRNSYNSGDWFNRIDWGATESTWGSGLPPRGDNESKWGFMRPLLADSGARAVAGRYPRRPRPRRRAAADPLLVAAVPARQRARDPAARELPHRRAGPDAWRDRDGDRGPRRHRGGLQRDAAHDYADHSRARPLRAAPGAGPGRRPGGAEVLVSVRRLVHRAGPDDRGVRRGLAWWIRGRSVVSECRSSGARSASAP